MSALTSVWTIERIREVMSALDEKTGLDGASLPIEFNYTWKSRMGEYWAPGLTQPEKFIFSSPTLNDPASSEAGMVDLIRHEYSHYLNHNCELHKWIKTPPRAHHGPDWKWACTLVNARPERLYSEACFPVITREEAELLYRADDVRKLNIRRHLELWKTLPMSPEEETRCSDFIRRRYVKRAYYAKGETVIHPTHGRGRILALYPDPVNFCQMLYVTFENGHAMVTDNGVVEREAG